MTGWPIRLEMLQPFGRPDVSLLFKVLLGSNSADTRGYGNCLVEPIYVHQSQNRFAHNAEKKKTTQF